MSTSLAVLLSEMVHGAVQSSNADLLGRVAEDYGLSKAELLARYGIPIGNNQNRRVPCAAINKKNKVCKRFAVPNGGRLCTLHAKRPDVRLQETFKACCIVPPEPEPADEVDTESVWDELERMLTEENAIEM